MTQTTIPLRMAVELKETGLIWRADINDFFGIPDRGMDERVFVVTDLMANLDIFRGWPVVTFHGAAEWALDYILTTEVVWLPTEGQLRQELESLLTEETPFTLRLDALADGYACLIALQQQTLTFSARTAAEAYGRALLHVLQSRAAKSV